MPGRPVLLPLCVNPRRFTSAIVRASAYFDYRLPEVFAGCPAGLMHAPVEYPTACSPQARRVFCSG